MSSGVAEADSLRTGNFPKGTFLPAEGLWSGAPASAKRAASVRCKRAEWPGAFDGYS